MDKHQQLKEGKAIAYDLIAQIQDLQGRLGQVNTMIKELSIEISNEESKKEDPTEKGSTDEKEVDPTPAE